MMLMVYIVIIFYGNKMEQQHMKIDLFWAFHIMEKSRNDRKITLIGYIK